MLQDKQGMIWIATWNGLLRFDGYQLTCFKSQVGDGCNIPTDRIRNIKLADNGNILCQIDDTPFIFDVATCTFKETKETLYVSGNYIWIDATGVARYTDRFGTEWVVTKDGRLEYVDSKSGKRIAYPLKESLGPIKCCMPDKQGNLWAYGTYNVSKLSFAQRPVDLIPMVKATEVRSLMVDNKNRYWMTGRLDKSVRLFDKENNELGYLTRHGSISKHYTSFGSSVYCMAQSSDGAIWLGCKPDGIFRLRETSERRFSVERIDGLNNQSIYDIVEDKQGRLWIATLGGGVNCIPDPSADKPQVLTPENQIGGYPEYVCRLVRNVHVMDDGTLFAATTEGLLVSRIPEDGNLSAMKFKVHTREADRKNSLSCSATMDIAEDSLGRIFIATESGGINMIETEDYYSNTLEFKHFNMNNGLASDITLSILPVGDNLFVVGNSMLMGLNPDSGVVNIYDSHFLRYDCRFSDAHPVCLPDGRWLFGLMDGAFAVHPENLRRSDFVPPIAFTGISVENENFLMDVNALDTLVLMPESRDMTIRFAALDYVDNNGLEYAFRLIGEDEENEWTNLGRNNTVTLLDMLPGEYLLQVRSTNADGVWTENTRNLTIIVEPKFIETVWAKMLFTLIVIILLSGIVYTVVYIRRIHRKQRETLEAYLALLNKSVEHEAVADEKPLKVSDEDNRLMLQVTAFVDANLSNADVSIGDMANALAMSRSGLQRRVKQVLGITPLDFLREARIKRACLLLKTSEMTVSEVAFACGFSDPKYFSRTFKSSFGVSPKDYRECKENAV